MRNRVIRLRFLGLMVHSHLLLLLIYQLLLLLLKLHLLHLLLLLEQFEAFILLLIKSRSEKATFRLFCSGAFVFLHVLDSDCTPSLGLADIPTHRLSEVLPVVQEVSIRVDRGYISSIGVSW